MKTLRNKNITTFIAAMPGYVMSAILLIQSVSVTVICALQYGIVNFIPPITETEPDIASTVLTRLVPPDTQSIGVQEPSTLLIFCSWVLVVLIILFLLIRTALLTARLLQFVVKKYCGRVTAKKLLLAKLGVLGVSLLIIVLASLLIPAIRIIVPLNVAFAAIGAICFIAQHAIYRYKKVPVKHMI